MDSNKVYLCELRQATAEVRSNFRKWTVYDADCETCEFPKITKFLS